MDTRFAGEELSGTDWVHVYNVEEMQKFYLSRLPLIRKVARELGYAIGLHGSTTRDFDLMAMQWIDDPVNKDTLAMEIMKAGSGFTFDPEVEIKWTQKPFGRVAISLPICRTSWPDCYNITGLGHIDLSLIERDTHGL